jgi:hypothetical protein
MARLSNDSGPNATGRPYAIDDRREKSRPNAGQNPDGGDLPGVMTMRTLQDARDMMDQLRSGNVARAVVIGGGPLGVEWVQGLKFRGVNAPPRSPAFREGALPPRWFQLASGNKTR